MTTAASVPSFNAVRNPKTRAPSVSPAMLRSAIAQMTATASQVCEAAAAGQITTMYCDAPAASAAVSPGSMMASDCQP